MHDVAVHDDFHAVQLIAPFDCVRHVQRPPGLNGAAEDRAVDAEIDFDPVPGQRIRAARADRIEDFGSR